MRQSDDPERFILGQNLLGLSIASDQIQENDTSCFTGSLDVMTTRSNHFPGVKRQLSSALLLWMALSAVSTWAATGPSATATAAAATGAHKIFHWSPFLAPFHAVVLHYPIGFITVAFILEIFGMRRPSPDAKQITRLVIWLSLLSGIVTAAFGILRADSGGYEVRAVEAHRWTGLGVVVSTLATLVVQGIAQRHATQPAWMYAYRGLLTLTLGLLVVAGHMGGNLTHGSKYLTENAPTFVREFLDEESPDPSGSVAAANLDENQRFYSERVQPIFNTKCLPCHGPEKQKGDYRLDQPEMALKGGKSNIPAIKAGAPMESHLAKLILLPPGDDDIMPPDGKEPLTPEETGIVLHWIRIGAPFGPSPTLSTNSP